MEGLPGLLGDVLQVNGLAALVDLPWAVEDVVEVEAAADRELPDALIRPTGAKKKLVEMEHFELALN